MKRIMLAGIACVLLPACQSADKTLSSTDRAIAVTRTPTAKTITDIAKAEGFADYLLDRQAKTRKVDVQEGAKDALYVTVAMVANFQNKQAEQYRGIVSKYAAQYRASTAWFPLTTPVRQTY